MKDELSKKYFQRMGRKGGKKRAANLTPEQRIDIARKAGKAPKKKRKSKPKK